MWQKNCRALLRSPVSPPQSYTLLKRLSLQQAELIGLCLPATASHSTLTVLFNMLVSEQPGYLQVNGHPIKQFTVFGKPHPEPYRLMEKLLVQQAELIGLELPKAAGSKLPFGAVYAVGDNPSSDIAGARAAGMTHYASFTPQ